MSLIKTLKIIAKNTKTNIASLYYAYQNSRTPLLPKIIIFITIGYALSPIDLIPDFIPVIGYLDDLIIIPALINLSIGLIPKDIMLSSKEMAKKRPPELKNNYLFAVIFVLIWIILLTTIMVSIITTAQVKYSD